MAWSKQAALGMLVAVVLWTAAPLMACVSGLGANADSDCCATMQNCGAMLMSGACCDLAPTHHPAATVSAYAPEHDQHAAVMAREAYLPILTNPNVGQQGFHRNPPPDPSPGGFSVLRI